MGGRVKPGHDEGGCDPHAKPMDGHDGEGARKAWCCGPIHPPPVIPGRACASPEPRRAELAVWRGPTTPLFGTFVVMGSGLRFAAPE